MYKIQSKQNRSILVTILSSPQCQRSVQYLPAHIQIQVRSACHCPFDQVQFRSEYLYPGNTAWMHTTSGIQIHALTLFTAKTLFWQTGAVRMPCNQQFPRLSGIIHQSFFRASRFFIISRRTCRIQHAKLFQRSPQIPHQKAGQSPSCRIEPLCLMTVCQRTQSRFISAAEDVT